MQRKCNERHRAPRVVVGLAWVLATAGCGTEGFAPDPLVEGRGADAFLTQLAKQCADYKVGNSQLDWLINNADDAYFVDETTKLYYGELSKEQYATDIDAFFPTGTNQPAMQCIYAQLPQTPPPAPRY